MTTWTPLQPSLDGVQLDEADDGRVLIATDPKGRTLDRSDVLRLHAALVKWLADQPLPPEVTRLNESAGGDPRLMRGGSRGRR